MSIAASTDSSLTPQSEIAARLARFQQKLAAADLPLAILTHPIDVLYLSGTMPDGWLLMPAAGEPTLFVRKSFSRAQYESPLADIRPFKGPRDAADAIRERLGDRPSRAGLDLDVAPAATYLKLAHLLPQIAWHDASPLIRQVRAIKSPWEIARCVHAARQHLAAFAAIRGLLAEGVSETDLSAAAEAAMRREGHQGLVRFRRSGMSLWFCVIASGVGAAYPTSFDGPIGGDGLSPASGVVAGRRPVRRGVPVMADILANFEGYHADITRTFCLGEPPDAIKRAHDFCREALRRVEELLRPGIPWEEVHRQVDAWAKAAGEPEGFMGYGDNRVKFFGHGIGLEVDEFPILAKGFGAPLEAGMVVAVEPKAYSPELGPAGLEMSYVIEEDGAHPLLGHPEEIAVTPAAKS
jgi:Xaa-Pro aminopeptidase